MPRDQGWAVLRQAGAGRGCHRVWGGTQEGSYEEVSHAVGEEGIEPLRKGEGALWTKEQGEVCLQGTTHT